MVKHNPDIAPTGPLTRLKARRANTWQKYVVFKLELLFKRKFGGTLMVFLIMRNNTLEQLKAYLKKTH